MQDVIIRFKTHHARYTVYNERKKTKNVRIAANLTKRRAKLLYDASNAIKDIQKVDFCFSNIHGDLKVRLVEPYNGRSVFAFNSMSELNDILLKMDLIDESIA